MNVLAVTLSAFPGGTDRSLRNLAYALEGSDIRITLGGPADSDLQKWWTGSGLQYLPLDLPERVGITGPGGHRTSPWELARMGLRTVRSIRRICKEAARFDVIHSNWLLTHLDAVIAGKLTKKPVVMEIHDIVPPGPGRRILTEAASRASVSVSVSNAVRGQLAESAQQNAVTIHQGIDTDLFSPGPRDSALRNELTQGNPSARIAAVIARLDPGKGIEHAIEAVGIVNRRYGRDVHLIILGAPAVDDGSYATMVRAQAAEVLPERHLFLPPREDVVNILRSVDMLLAPSIDEPFGLVAAEAQSVGVPVVVSDSGGLPEFVLDGTTGYVVATAAPGAIAGAIDELIADPSGVMKMSVAARNHMVAEFDIRRRAERMRDQYWSVMADDEGGRRR